MAAEPSPSADVQEQNQCCIDLWKARLPQDLPAASGYRIGHRAAPAQGRLGKQVLIRGSVSKEEGGRGRYGGDQ